MITTAAGVYLTATAAIAEPLLTKSGRPACGNVKTKGNKVATRAMRVTLADKLQKELEASLADPAKVAELQAKIDHHDACIADLDTQIAATKAPAPKVQAPRAVVRR
jgi:hypothetical protein